MNGWTKVHSSPMLRKGWMVVFRKKKVVWIGPLGSPIEDVEYDEVALAPEDFERLKAAAAKAKT